MPTESRHETNSTAGWAVVSASPDDSGGWYVAPPATRAEEMLSAININMARTTQSPLSMAPSLPSPLTWESFGLDGLGQILTPERFPRHALILMASPSTLSLRIDATISLSVHEYNALSAGLARTNGGY